LSTVTTQEARWCFGELIERAAQGEEIQITRDERPIARLVPESIRDLGEVRAAVDGLLQLQEDIRRRSHDAGVLSDAEVRAAIEEGRR